MDLPPALIEANRASFYDELRKMIKCKGSMRMFEKNRVEKKSLLHGFRDFYN